MFSGTHVECYTRKYEVLHFWSKHTNVSFLQVYRRTTEQITCNSEPMEKEIVSERTNDGDYVYDIYYTNSQQFDFRLFERDLTFQAFGGDLMFDRDTDDVEEEFVYGDDDDENDESNWRNDYPEEDPHYIEANQGDYGYEEGKV